MKSTNRRSAWAGLTAQDVMVRDIVSVAPHSPLAEVERLLAERRISGMPVVDERGHALGVVSYRDLADGRRAASAPRTASDVMTPAIVDVATDASIEEICRTMVRNSVHRVLVTDTATGRMVGIVSSIDVLAAVAGD
jgi:predicted transcriptional regulator